MFSKTREEIKGVERIIGAPGSSLCGCSGGVRWKSVFERGGWEDGVCGYRWEGVLVYHDGLELGTALAARFGSARAHDR